MSNENLKPFAINENFQKTSKVEQTEQPEEIITLTVSEYKEIISEVIIKNNAMIIDELLNYKNTVESAFSTEEESLDKSTHVMRATVKNVISDILNDIIHIINSPNENKKEIHK